MNLHIRTKLRYLSRSHPLVDWMETSYLHGDAIYFSLSLLLPLSPYPRTRNKYGIKTKGDSHILYKTLKKDMGSRPVTETNKQTTKQPNKSDTVLFPYYY